MSMEKAHVVSEKKEKIWTGPQVALVLVIMIFVLR